MRIDPGRIKGISKERWRRLRVGELSSRVVEVIWVQVGLLVGAKQISGIFETHIFP
jgi:hypothetical protein